MIGSGTLFRSGLKVFSSERKQARALIISLVEHLCFEIEAGQDGGRLMGVDGRQAPRF
jgi:hypothetical protein